MHEIIFSKLCDFIEENYGAELFITIHKEAGLTAEMLTTNPKLPGDDIVDLIDATSKILNLEREFVLESFGMYLAPTLLNFYKSHINKKANSIDLIEQFAKLVNETDLTKLKITRDGLNKLSLMYSSRREMIGLGVGVIKAIAKECKESVIIERKKITEGTLLCLNKL